MPETEIPPQGPETFEDCHVCGHQPQHVQFMASVPPTHDHEALRHRYVCTHCNEGTPEHDTKAYAGLNWNGKQLREAKKAREREAERLVRQRETENPG